MSASDGHEAAPASRLLSASATAFFLLVFGCVWLLAQRFGAAPQEPWQAVALGTGLLALAYVDWRWRRLPDALTAPVAILGLALAASRGTLGPHLAGLVAGYLAIAGLRALWLGLRRVEAIGLGDAKLIAAGGAWIGAAALAPALTLASLSGLMAAALARVGGGRATSIAFGPHLALGVWVMWCWKAAFWPAQA